jgi:hypothetical protein
MQQSERELVAGSCGAAKEEIFAETRPLDGALSSGEQRPPPVLSR